MFNGQMIYILIASLGLILWINFVIKRKVHKIIKLLAIVVAVFILIYSLFPHRLFNLDSDEVTRISVFNGSTGQSLEIKEKDDINYLVNELNSSKSKIDSLAMFRMGYSFRISIYSEEKVKCEFILNDSTTIRDKGLFWKIIEHPIDYGYILNLYQEAYEDE